MISVRTVPEKQQWDDYILDHEGHPLQLWGWGEVKATHNWQVERVTLHDLDQRCIGAAQLLIRRLPKPFRALVYIPRGPVIEHEADRPMALEALANYAKSQYGAVALTVEPDWAHMPDVPGWHEAENTILIPRTLILDLAQSEDELLAAMTKKTRQYIRKSAKEAIDIRQVKTADEVGKCLEIYKQTADRAGFKLHGDEYYYDIFAMLGEHSPVFAAYVDDDPVAFLWLAISQDTAFELYGGMNGAGQQLRANYALKWHVIRTVKQWGVARYDMNGLLNDGVSTFKQGFASHEDMLAGTYDRPLSPLYKMWVKGLPAAKRVIRAVKR